MRRPDPKVTVVGGGLAGCEAAWQLLTRGVPVLLVDIKPHQRTPAHQSDDLAELVCSNSLKSDRLQNAAGLLKEEMRRLNSLIIRAADATRVPAGGALAVDREAFSAFVTRHIREHPLLTYQAREVTDIPEGPCIIATGPLTTASLCEKISMLSDRAMLSFYDAAAPIVTAESIDMSRVFRASRYGRGDDYLNCPLDEETYLRFREALATAQTAPVHGFEEQHVFEACMPVEVLAKRGEMALAYGPMRPVGLRDPATGKRPYANVQLRQEDTQGQLYNLVGFQTRLTFGEQKRVFGMIPGLENPEYARFGVMHRNTFLSSPGFLDDLFRVIGREELFFAGQLTGVEGYVESAASGLVCGLTMALTLAGHTPPHFPGTTALGALCRHVSTPNRDYQPMRISFGLMDVLPERVRNKEQRYLQLSQRALEHIDAIIDNLPHNPHEVNVCS